MVSSPITNGVMSGVPKTQAGMASGMNSSSRQLGQSLGVAIVGSVLAASIRGSMQAGFVRAAHAAGGSWRAAATSCSCSAWSARRGGPGDRGQTALPAYLTEPAVRPPTTRPSMRANRMNTGMVATTEAPNRCCQSTVYWPMNESRRTVSG